MFNAWCAESSAQQIRPVGRLKRNAFGLFGMLGNAIEWRHESMPHVDCNPNRNLEGPSPVDGGIDRFLRGGA
jgi:formylglycine-generating enzyme required for sulfatase activity